MTRATNDVPTPTMVSGNQTVVPPGDGNLSAHDGVGCAPLNFSHPIKMDIQQFSIAATVGVLTIVGNFLSILVIGNILRRRKDTRNGSTIYLCALASSDFLQALFVYPIHIAAQVKGQWIGGFPACMLMAFAGNFFYILSAFIVTLLAIVRFFATSQPLSFRHRLEATNLWIYILIGVIAFAATITALPFTKLGCISFHASGAICSYHWYAVGIASTSTIAILGSQSVMLLIIIVCTIGTIYSLQAHSGRHAMALKRMERNFSMGVVAIATVEVICWGPFVVWQSINRVTPLEAQTVGMVVGYLTFFVSVFNPIVFACMMKQYRSDIRRLVCLVFCCERCRYDDDHDSDSSRQRRISSSSANKPLVTANRPGPGQKGNISPATENILKRYAPQKDQRSPRAPLIKPHKGNGKNYNETLTTDDSQGQADTEC